MYSKMEVGDPASHADSKRMRMKCLESKMKKGNGLKSRRRERAARPANVGGTYCRKSDVAELILPKSDE